MYFTLHYFADYLGGLDHLFGVTLSLSSKTGTNRIFAEGGQLQKLGYVDKLPAGVRFLQNLMQKEMKNSQKN